MPRELSITAAVTAIQKINARLANEYQEAMRDAEARTCSKLSLKRSKMQERILSRVHPSARDLVLSEAAKDDPLALGGDAMLGDAPPDSEPLTPADVAALEEGRAAIQRGEGLTTAEVRRELDVADQPVPKGVTEYVPGPAAKAAARGR